MLTGYSVSAHCYSIWKYNFPQRCGVQRYAHAAPARTNSDKFGQIRLNDEIPLPSLEPVIGGDADDDTRARLLLRATVGQ